MKKIKCSKPKGYIKTNIYFESIDSANKYEEHLKKEFTLNKAKELEYPKLSKRKKKDISFSKPKKYLLTKVGSSLLLWESIK